MRFSTNELVKIQEMKPKFFRFKRVSRSRIYDDACAIMQDSNRERANAV